MGRMHTVLIGSFGALLCELTIALNAPARSPSPAGTHAPTERHAPSSAWALDSLAWIAGCWEGRFAGGRVVSEQWMKPLGGMMLGMSRTVKDGNVVEFEAIRLEQSEDGSIRYVARPSSQPEATFTLVTLDPGRIVFENPSHDYPQRIIYTLITADSLVARIEGQSGAKTLGSEFRYRRISCQ
ncbi:MAG: hypothetical protein H6Q29_1181 [Bacteroidetes bacterium]|nr:hypothetical protein [Bacteroidota bacterium]